MAPLYHALIAAFHGGDRAEAERLQAISAETCELVAGTGGFGSGLKAILKTMGLDLGGMRRPQVNLSPEAVTKLVASLEDAGTFEYLSRTT
jgi:N-acetylneuraminate lyase